VANQRPYFIS